MFGSEPALFWEMSASYKSMIIESEADLTAKVCVLTKQLGSPNVTSSEDYISTMSFSQCGSYFALGDHSGRLIIFGDYNGELKYFTEVTTC